MNGTQTKSGRCWAVVGFFTLFMALMTYNLIIYPACAVTAMTVFGIGQTELTTLTSVTSLVGVFCGLIFGKMLDTKDVRKSILTFLAVGTALFFVRAFVLNYTATLVLTFLASFCVGICQVAAPKVIATWFPPEKIGFASSFFVAGSGLGSAGGFALGGALGIEKALLSIGILHLALLAYWLLIGGEGPFKQAAPAAGEKAPKDAAKASGVFKSRNLWLIIIAYSMAMTASMTLNSYLINSFISKGLDPAKASLMGTVLNVCLCAGGFIMTALLGVVKKFNPLMSAAMIGGGAMVLLAWFTPIGGLTWVFVALGGLFFGGSLGLCIGRIPLVPLTGDFGPALIGQASSFSETVKGLISFVLPILVANVFGTNFNGIFIVFGVCCALAFITGGLLIPELGEKGKLFRAQK